MLATRWLFFFIVENLARNLFICSSGFIYKSGIKTHIYIRIYTHTQCLLLEDMLTRARANIYLRTNIKHNGWSEEGSKTARMVVSVHFNVHFDVHLQMLSIIFETSNVAYDLSSDFLHAHSIFGILFTEWFFFEKKKHFFFVKLNEYLSFVMPEQEKNASFDCN